VLEAPCLAAGGAPPGTRRPGGGGIGRPEGLSIGPLAPGGLGGGGIGFPEGPSIGGLGAELAGPPGADWPTPGAWRPGAVTPRPSAGRAGAGGATPRAAPEGPPEGGVVAACSLAGGTGREGASGERLGWASEARTSLAGLLRTTRETVDRVGWAGSAVTGASARSAVDSAARVSAWTPSWRASSASPAPAGAAPADAPSPPAAGSAGAGGRRRPSRSALRRTRSACASSMDDEWLFTPIPRDRQSSRASLFVRPSSRASS
jgi:hypothetical protein